jgi:hypothetical protein
VRYFVAAKREQINEASVATQELALTKTCGFYKRTNQKKLNYNSSLSSSVFFLNIFKDQTKTTYYPIFRGGRPNHTIQIIK